MCLILFIGFTRVVHERAINSELGIHKILDQVLLLFVFLVQETFCSLLEWEELLTELTH